MVIKSSFLCGTWVDVPLFCFSAIILSSSLLRRIWKHSNLWVSQGIIKNRKKGGTVITSSLSSQYSLQTWIHLSVLEKMMLIHGVHAEILCRYKHVWNKDLTLQKLFIFVCILKIPSPDLPCYLKKNKAEWDNPMLKNTNCLHPASESNRQAFPYNFYIEQGNMGKQTSFIFRKIWTWKATPSKF